MQLVVKVASDHLHEGAAAIENAISKCGDSDVWRHVKISPVFPDVSTGRRAGLFTIELPDDLSLTEVEPLLGALRSDKRLEYAEAAAPRTPLGDVR